jgi:hypothetical protein
MKMAQALKNERLFKKVEDKIKRLLLPLPLVNLEHHDEDMTTLDSVDSKGKSNKDDDDNDI